MADFGEGLSEVRFLKFDSNDNFQESIHSKTAFISEENWNLENAGIVNLSKNIRIIDNVSIPTIISLKKIDKTAAA